MGGLSAVFGSLFGSPPLEENTGSQRIKSGFAIARMLQQSRFYLAGQTAEAQ
jgi:hypothetical protein